MNEYMTESETSELTRFARGTLRNLRSRGEGPPYLKLNGRIRYKRADVIAWLESGSVAA